MGGGVFVAVESAGASARTGPWRTVESVELANPELGVVTQHQPSTRLSGRRPSGRVRSRILRFYDAASRAIPGTMYRAKYPRNPSSS